MFVFQQRVRGLAVTAFLGMIIATKAVAVNVTLAWNANPEPDIAGYRVYFGTNTARYTLVLNVGNVTSTIISNLQFSTAYYFALTAYNSAGLESEFSNEAVAQTFQHQAPTLDPIPDVAVPEDFGLFSVALTGISSGAGQTQPTITARSSNPAVLPDPAISYDANSGQAFLSLQSVQNGFGIAVVIVTVDNREPTNNTVSRAFSVTIEPQNDPPQLSLIRSQALEQDSMPRLVFLSGISSGAPNELQALSVTAVSDNPDVVRNPLAFYNSPAFSGVLVLEPAGTNGTANVTVTISDGEATTSRTFSVLVQPANEPPTIAAVPDQAMPQNQSVAIPVSIGDESLPAETLTVSASSSDPEVLGADDIVIEGSGASRAVRLRHGRGRSGRATITITVSDGHAVSTVAFDVNVVSGFGGELQPQTATSADAMTIPETPLVPLQESPSPLP